MEGKAKGHHVVIVDDLIMSGGTVVECVGALKKAGATAVSAYVTHAVFPRDTWRQFTGEIALLTVHMSPKCCLNQVRLFQTRWFCATCPLIAT